MRKEIILGIGTLIILLALAGTGSAKPDGTFGWGCNGCHPSISAENATFYNQTHRYNNTVITPPDCNYCHVDVMGHGIGEVMNLSLINNGTPTYLNSTTCKNCHKAKYDNWTNTMHRVMLTDNTTAEAMNLPTPSVGWANISYVIVTKFELGYINTTGYFLAENDSYETDTKEFANSSHAGQGYGTCGRCHTTNWNGTNANITLSGISGNFSEPGIGCERCHEPAGNGHQVVVDYSADLCSECHTGSSHATGWDSGAHGTPLNASTDSCSLLCHSPFDSYQNLTVTSASATNVACGVCHNIHDMTDSKYADTFSNGTFNNETWANISDAKLSYFNATASQTAGTDIFDILLPGLLFAGNDSRKDTSYGDTAINVTGPTSEVLCSMCHYKHGLSKVAGANLTHSRNTSESSWATCTDCHMQGANASVGRDMMKLHANDPFSDVNKSCGSATKCHTSSTQNLSASNGSIVPIQREWKATAHNDKETSVNHSNPNSSFYRSINGTTGEVTIKSRQNSCNKCHSPFDWNPATDSNTTNVQLNSDFKGIICNVCHNIHDMGDWINRTGKYYGWYDRDAIELSPTEYQADYTEMDNTTELCGNCHSNVRIDREGPGWNGSSNNPTSPHGFPAKDVFVGSWKQTSDLNFECIDCHMYVNKTNATGDMLNDSEKITGHSFAVNESGLQNTTRCSGCHDGTNYGTIASVIEQIQADTNDKWNTTNATVEGALAAYKAYSGAKDVSADKIAQAYWNLKLVSSDESWGVHDPVETNLLLDDALALAEASNASLGQGEVSTVNLTAGWNLVALNGTPSDTSAVSVMSSVASNISVVWGYNTSQANPSLRWELYDPAMPSSLNTLENIVPAKGYWIYAIRDCVWTV